VLLVVTALTLPNEVAAQDSTATPSSTPRSGRVLITQKLDSIVVDKINFDKADVADVINFLQKKSKELDPDKQGINFVLSVPPATDASSKVHREISLTLDNIRLGDILKEICSQTNLEFRVEDFAVFLDPAGETTETMSTRSYLVPTGFFASTASDNTTDMKKALIAHGVSFADGASATFIPTSGKLVVRNTPKQLDLITTLFDGYGRSSADK